jgi:hypothetical protein
VLRGRVNGRVGVENFTPGGESVNRRDFHVADDRGAPIMPDKRTHRGAHPQDAEIFAPSWHATLRQAVADLSWLLSRAYATPSAVKIVGDRYGLSARQRTAVTRCACGDEARSARLGKQVALAAARGREVLIDGYNVLTTIEVALGGGWILAARDTAFRDMASIHGSYRKVEETRPAIELLGRTLADAGVARVVLYLDQPVSNSGRLKGIINEIAAARSWPWEVRIVANPDRDLIAAEGDAIIASADSVVMDGCARWVNLAREVVTPHVPDAKVVDLRV